MDLTNSRSNMPEKENENKYNQFYGRHDKLDIECQRNGSIWKLWDFIIEIYGLLNIIPYDNFVIFHFESLKRQLLRLHENHQNVKFHLNEPSLKESDPFRFHSYYLVTRPKTYAQNITKRVSPLMPIQVKPLSGPRVSF